MRRGSIGPSILEALETNPALAELVEHVEQVPGRARQAVEAGDHEDVAGLESANHLGQLGSVGLGARYFLLEDLGAAGSHKLCVLSGQVLVAGRDPRISE